MYNRPKCDIIFYKQQNNVALTKRNNIKGTYKSNNVDITPES